MTSMRSPRRSRLSDFVHDPTPITSRDFDDPFLAFTTLLRVGLRSIGYYLSLLMMIAMLLLGYFYFAHVIPLMGFEDSVYQIIFKGASYYMLFNLLFNYVQCLRTQPGYLDASMEEEYAALCAPEERSFCQICNMNRPPRAHHCKVCRRCVMRMDHHCRIQR
eukprot:TRINITY_DN4748_c0_g2_i3.p1 TRINITY_DN4748_c0_g2~~TRINITY_DN4748_c0_g2_i3.p1  ORF type:complete len:162 (-),score=30.87 TRINITY_DN4748_c0_g2_i3:560-1045(-)